MPRVRLRYLVTSFLVLAIAGTLALMPERRASAGLDDPGFSVTPLVIFHDGEVTMTVTGTDDEAEQEWVFVYGDDSAIIGQGVGTCEVGGDPCASVGDIDCDGAPGPALPDGVLPAGTVCTSLYLPDLDEDEDEDPFTWTPTFDLFCESEPQLITLFANEVFQEGTADPELGNPRSVDVLCLPEPNLVVSKVFVSNPALPFTFTYSGPGCVMQEFDDDNEPSGFPVPVLDNFTFQLRHGEEVQLFCGLGEHTVTEQAAAGAAFNSVGCGESDGEPDPAGGPSVSLTLDEQNLDLIAICEFVNVEAPDDDDPTTPDLSAVKVCTTTTGFDADFQLTVAGVTAPAGCGDTVTAIDVGPGDYTVSETISGPDAGAFTTLIVCEGGGIVVGRSAPVTVPEGDNDIVCVVINIFTGSPGGNGGGPGGDDDGDADGDGIPDIIALPVNIEIDNDNTNVIGLDNDNTNTNANNSENENENENTNVNENNNVNTNTQNQENRQDQENENKQTNNINASPEIDIDLGD